MKLLKPLLLAALSACGSSTADTHGPYPAPHPPMPQVQSQMGPVMTAPQLVPISFQGDPLAGPIDTFIAQLVANSSYWSGATAEYGVGPLTSLPPQHVAEAAPGAITDAQIQDWLTSKILSGAFPRPDGNKVYVIFYPKESAITNEAGTSCQEPGFNAYHGDYVLVGNGSAAPVSYVVVGRCPPPVPSATDMDMVSGEASHEIIEVGTDPRPTGRPAYNQIDPDDVAWALIAGPEVGDLCAGVPEAFYRPTGFDTLVQRVWSNAAAAASHDPCQPQGASPYFNSAAVLPDMIQIPDARGLLMQTKGVQIPVGSERDVEIDLYSDAPTSGPWILFAQDVSNSVGATAATLSFTFRNPVPCPASLGAGASCGQGQNGDKLHLSVKALAKSPLGASPFWILSKLDTHYAVWTGLVGN